MTGKRVQFDDETWQALALLARDRMMDFQELADEAFRDLLHKHGRPTDLKSALRQSVGQDAATDAPKTTPRKRRGSGR
jgi:predicted DNA-binding ribbon-helix-helix protein